MATGIEAQPLDDTGYFNWVFVVSILVVVILAIFFLFYFNRLFATIISFAIRAYTWNRYKAYVDIEALQISLLGGRVFFKSIRYHAHNVTLYVYEGHVTWRYWLRTVQGAEVFRQDVPPANGVARSFTPSSDENSGGHLAEKAKPRSRSLDKEEKAGIKPKKELPCRISVNVSGVEAFLYNRSPVYDAIVEATMGRAKESSDEKRRKDTNDGLAESDSRETENDEGELGPGAMRTQTSDTVASTVAKEEPKIPAFLKMLPVQIECKRAAAALGNESTKNIIVAKAEKAAGTVDAARAGPLDLWKLLFSFDIEQVMVAMKPNRDFKVTQLDAAQSILRQREQAEQGLETSSEPIRQSGQGSLFSFCKWLLALLRPKSSTSSLRTASVYEGKSVQSMSAPGKPSFNGQSPLQAQWHGLKRYLDETELNEHEEWQRIEYAKSSELVNCPKITLRFHWDMPGLVGNRDMDTGVLLDQYFKDDINGSKPPDYGIDLGIHGGVIVYGPWADRQRVNLQPIFVPATYTDAVSTRSLKPGDMRLATTFKIQITMEENVVVRLPTREESKDSRWKGRAEQSRPDETQTNEPSNESTNKPSKRSRRKAKKGTKAVDARPYAWIDITVKKDSVVNYLMDMYARSDGYHNTLDVDAKGVEIASSVNHGLLWKSGAVTVHADLSQPLTWNTLRQWPFEVKVDDMELFILRDHLFLIIDLVNDWASGAPAEFYTFVPYKYQLGLTLNNFIMYLNVNDANIINDPENFERNDFLTIEGQLTATLGIPMEHYRPRRNQISFDVLAKDLKMRMLSSAKSTLNTFVQDKTMAQLPKLTLNGSFNGNQEIRVGNVDVLRMDIVGSGLIIKAFGFYVRQLINIKENYFGDYMHFKTLEEFQGASDDLEEANIKTASFPKPTSINEMDVILCIVAEDATVLLPTNLYSGMDFIRAELPRADLDLRIVSYYLDMSLQLSPLSLLSGSTLPDEDADEISTNTASSTQLYVQHVDLNGHRSFGLSPNEEAYVSQWDIDVGKITGELSCGFLHDLILAARAFAFGIKDAENALPVTSPAVALDAGFVQMRTSTVRLWLNAGKDAVLLELEPIVLETSDWASEMFSQRISLLAPLITLACVDCRSVSRVRSLSQRKKSARTYAFIQTGLSLDIVGRKTNFELETKRQQRHFRLNDQRTGRFGFLIRTEVDAPIEPNDDIDFQPPAMPYPYPPPPVSRTNAVRRKISAKPSRSFVRDRVLVSQPSTSSLAASIREARPALQARRPGLPSRATEQSGTSASFRSFARSEHSAVGSTFSKYLPHEVGRGTLDPAMRTMAFSSSYSEPYFPLGILQPDMTNVPSFPSIRGVNGIEDDSSSKAEMIDNPDSDPNIEHKTIMIKIAPGVRAYIEPHVATVASQVLEKCLPMQPEELMDAFQMDVMGDIDNQASVTKDNNSVVEIQAHIPAANLRVALLDGEKDRITDQLDLIMDTAETMIRVKSQSSDAGVVKSFALHSQLSWLQISLCERLDEKLVSPAIFVEVDDVLLWLSLNGENAFHVSLRETLVAIAGSQAKYLTKLALRLIPLVNSMKSMFEDISSNSDARLRLLTYILTQDGEDVGEPPFMARMVYVLRAFPQHFRNTDSWKILARFRYILQNLPARVKSELRTYFRDARSNCPRDAASKVLESWNEWRAWDVIHVNETTAFKKLVSQEEIKRIDPSSVKPTNLTFRSETLRLTILAENGSSDVVLQEASLGLENIPPTKPEGLMLVEENKRTKTVVQMHTDTITFSLDWTLFHIAEDAISLQDDIEKLSMSLQSKGSRSAGQAFGDGLARHDFHVVLSTNTGSIRLRSINLRHLSQADGLKISVIGTNQAEAVAELGVCISAIINVDTAITELHGPSSMIWQSRLSSPSIYIDQLYPAPGLTDPPTITLAGAYDSLAILVSEQVPGILHIIDSVVLDEVAKVQRLVQLSARSQLTSLASPAALPISRTKTNQNASSKLHVALLAGTLDFEVALLSTLRYQLQGKAASLRVAPSLSRDQTFSIDFDVGRHNHAFVNISGNEIHTQDLIEVPPINGNVGVELGLQETSVSVATTIERIEVDAGAIQGLIAIITRPEVQNVMSAIEAGVDDIRVHVVQVFPRDDAPHPNLELKKQKQRIVFDARLALLGVRVSASTPQVLGHSTAEVEFGIGPVHATASNRATPTEIVPEVRAQIQGIGASLAVKEGRKVRPCGNATLSIQVHLGSERNDEGSITRELTIRSNGLDINAYPETASTIVDVINHLQDRIRHLDLSKEVEYLRRLRDERRNTVIQRISGKSDRTADGELPFSPEDLLSTKTTIQLHRIQACWIVDSSFAARPGTQVNDLVFSIQSVEFITRIGNEARLTIADVQLQLVKKKDINFGRSLNSALMPYISFSVGYWSHGRDRSLTFRASGKPLDLRLESSFVLPVVAVQRSIEHAIDQAKKGAATWQNTPTTTGAPRSTTNMFDTKHLASLLIEADFAGARVYLQGSVPRDENLSTLAAAAQQQSATPGRYGQFATQGALMQTSLTAPGIAFKLEYNRRDAQPTVNGELLIEASSNLLLPNVVPLMMEVSSCIREVVRNHSQDSAPPKPTSFAEPAGPTQRFFEEDSLVATTPAKIFGKTKVDLGFRIAKQEFGLTCQPIARVDATASLEDFYVTMNTIASDEHGHFFAMSAVMTKLQAQVKHMYSREPTFRYDLESIVLSAMNNKHLSGTPGVSAILKINPTKIIINGKQFQDLLLFQEIWLPPEIRNAAAPAATNASVSTSTPRPDEYLVQKYQTVAAAAAFPWNATVSIAMLAVDVDLGQSIGKTNFTITNFWASQRKSSSWEQNLCVGLDEVTMKSTGRMSGFIQLEKLGIRTSIKWPEENSEGVVGKTPRIQASIGFKKLMAKAAFDYKAFAFGDIESLDFLMYNVRDGPGEPDRLVAVLDCAKAFVFCTSTSPAQAVGLYQAFDRLIQDKHTAYMQSLKDIEKHLRRKSTIASTRSEPRTSQASNMDDEEETKKSPIKLHTDVVVTMGAVCFGVYPSTFFDSQMLKLEANNIQTRFAAGLESGMIASALGMTLGQLQVSLSSARRLTAVPKALEVTAEEVISNALNAKGGTILRVPKVVASMQTWQVPDSNRVDYIFKSLFDGKIDVGWNLSRINFIKGMWMSHSRALASRLGKSLPESAVRITAGRDESSEGDEKEQEKITAEINLPQSRYDYHALQVPLIETPQLRDMGEATPPLEWIGLQRDRLPNATHQVIIVSLLEVVREIESAYGKILGSS